MWPGESDFVFCVERREDAWFAGALRAELVIEEGLLDFEGEGVIGMCCMHLEGN